MLSDRSVSYSPVETRPCWFGFTAEEGNAAADPGAECPLKSPDRKDEPKGGVIQWTPPAMSVEEKTDDEGINSSKTSVESLREANENNSNNGGPHRQGGGLTRGGGVHHAR